MRLVWYFGGLSAVMVGCAEGTIPHFDAHESTDTQQSTSHASVSGEDGSTDGASGDRASGDTASRDGASADTASGEDARGEDASDTGGQSVSSVDHSSQRAASDVTVPTSDTQGRPTSCKSHEDCESDEVCVTPDTAHDNCEEGACVKGVVCGLADPSVCDPNQVYTVDENGNIVPEERWKGRLCYDCRDLNCGTGACFMCTSPPG